MGRKAARTGSKARARKRKMPVGPPLPLTPIDLLAGLGPNVELLADDLPPGIGTEAGGSATPALTTVAETGKMLRAGDATIRRLVRTRGVLAGSADPIPRAVEPDRAGVVPRTPDKPGE
jgi:hypothetical protein